MATVTNILQIAVKVACSISNIKSKTGILTEINVAKTHMDLKPYHPSFHKMQSPPLFSDVCL